MQTLFRFHRWVPGIQFVTGLTVAFAIVVLSARGQAPALQWSANVNAHVFAVDAETNSYAYTPGGAVVVCSAAGAVTQTTPVCNKGGMAQRDSAGNYYFFGVFDGINDFGGVTLVGGWANPPFPPGTWLAGFPSCFLAKYDGGGHLFWATNFGYVPYKNVAGDIVINPDDSVTVAYSPSGNSGGGANIAQFLAQGGVGWQYPLFPGGTGSHLWPVRLSSRTAATGFMLTCYEGFLGSCSYDASGIQQVFSDGVLVSPSSYQFENNLYTNAKPVIATNTSFVAGFTNNTPLPVLSAWRGGNVLWSVSLPVEQWVLAGDAQNNLYLGGVDGTFSKYDGNGTLIWSTNYGPPAVAMLVDASGNRFVSFNDGSVARMKSDDPAQLPSITGQPRAVEAFAGDMVSLSVSATGTPPLAYSWISNGTNVSGANGSTLTLSAATSGQSGNYAAVVTDAAGSVTSAPAALLIKNVELFDGSKMLTNGTYGYLAPFTLTIRSAFPNGEEYYTLDGSIPSFTSILYAGPFVVSNSATVRAIGYSSDFSKSEYADTAMLTLPSRFLLSVSTPGGGTLSGGGGLYLPNRTVTITATPANGWSFLYWQGAAAGTNPTINVTMNAAKSVEAIFGTTLTTTVTGNGQILSSPPVGPYAYGSVVRLEGLPDAGHYFGAWGNAVSSTSNPLYFTLTNATPTISAIFAVATQNQAALTVLISGQGQVGVNPPGNVFIPGQPLTLTATPNAGASFLRWSGGATGTPNPLTLNLNQSVVITANFTGATARLAASTSGQTSGGFTFTLISDPGSIYQILVSTNLSTWQSLGTVTNISGQTQFTDSGAVNSKARFYRAQQ